MIFPLQYFGIGDVIFSQTLIRNLGTNILWPVQDMFVEGLQRAYPDINFVNKSYFHDAVFNIKDRRTVGGLQIEPIRWADSILKLTYTDCMRAKYMMYGQDYKLWKVHAMYKRDKAQEKKLFDSLGITGKYNLISQTFQTNFGGKKQIPVNNGFQNIEMKFIPGFSLFDWSLVIERAEEIHAVSSAILYILELLDLKQPIHLYPRTNEYNLSNVDYLFTKPYILHV